MTGLTLARREKLQRRGARLEWFTITWNVLEAVVAIGAGLLAGVGLYTAFGWWWADPVGALAMLPVILWQGWETFEDARKEK